ncbi:hypothetical protein EBL_c27420 [Shimwellia blattae DSM 4481 = NBRC 105725]|uniref:Uncharacterized protein n=1 Tax=Shimwellia blattae (strain ATCC 29907 / DSM 4481 / JCM 1650 / NBRC 105725 / CDC 9005-74) TaxID=630626 RepID=I2BBA9_SHIBC|nr:hypothetical protein EBL_c27420 [Shimwellia blattae DSM 4481 = NBRC 105725]
MGNFCNHSYYFSAIYMGDRQARRLSEPEARPAARPVIFSSASTANVAARFILPSVHYLQG